MENELIRFILSIAIAAPMVFMLLKILIRGEEIKINELHEKNSRLKRENQSLMRINNDNAEHIETLHRAVDEEYDKKVRRQEFMSFLKQNRLD
ncbi:hypothetical protein WAF17_02335 [Bernardetia sp. ABR2-2B]|uniref:hypothetical protein n=1 Tax=Bernardetia sp. ABR2-2B TaxID=3127472 RepID=UPI0030CE3CA4